MQFLLKNPASSLRSLQVSCSVRRLLSAASTSASVKLSTTNQQVKPKIIYPFKEDDFFGVKNLITVEKLFK